VTAKLQRRLKTVDTAPVSRMALAPTCPPWGRDEDHDDVRCSLNAAQHVCPIPHLVQYRTLVWPLWLTGAIASDREYSDCDQQSGQMASRGREHVGHRGDGHVLTFRRDCSLAVIPAASIRLLRARGAAVSKDVHPCSPSFETRANARSSG